MSQMSWGSLLTTLCPAEDSNPHPTGGRPEGWEIKSGVLDKPLPAPPSCSGAAASSHVLKMFRSQC